MLSRIEQALGIWGRFVSRRAGWVIAFVLLLTAGLATQLPHFYMDASTEGYFHQDDPIRIQYDRFRSQFGRDTLILVALRPRAGIFDLEFLEILRSLHDEIESEVPLLVEVTSLINARDTRGLDDGLEVGELFEQWPENQLELDVIRARALANPLYPDYLFSESNAITTILIETQAYSQTGAYDELEGFGDEEPGGAAREPVPLSGDEDLSIALALYEVLDRYRSDELEIHAAGMTIFSSMLNERMKADMGVFIGLSLLIVAGFLTMLFRRVAAVVLPLITVGLTVLSTVAFMAATGTPMMSPTQVIPSFLMAVGVGGSVHLLAIFYQARRAGQDKESAISHALAHSGLPIAMTSLTTAGGLLSFIPAALRPISHFGWVTPVGVLLGMVFTLVLLPAMIAVTPMRAADDRGDNVFSQRLLMRIGRFSTQNAKLVLIVWLFAIGLSITGLVQVHLGHHMLNWFPEEEPIRKAMVLMNDEFGGATNFELVIHAEGEKGVQDPQLLEKMDAIQRRMYEIEVLGIHSRKSISIVDVVKETHQALNENREVYYSIPNDKRLIAQELLLFENSGSDDVEDLVDPDYTKARITVRVPLRDGAFYDPYLDVVRAEVTQILGPDVKYEITGQLRLLANTITAALQTMVQSYSTAFVVITVLMILLIGRVRLGLVSMLPNLAPIACTIGLMGWIGIPMDMFTLTIGTIAIGLAVDDTIHFMHNFRREFERTGDVDRSVEATLRGTGQALLFTSLVLAASFLVYTQAYMTNLHWFGILTSFAIVLAFVADITLAPALVKVFVRAPRDVRS